jgi:trigger factor
MNIAKEKTGACRWKISVEVPADRVLAKYEEVLKAVMQEARVDGFRPGRAPRALVESKYAKVILDEVKDAVVREAYQEARQKAALKVVEIVDVEEPAILVGQPVRLSFTVDVAPTFDLPEYRNIPVKSQPAAITPKEVEAVKQDLLRSRERWEKVEGRPVQAGDLVTVSYEGVCEGKAVSELDVKLPLLGKAEDVPVLADETPWLPGFGKALVGAQVGENKEVWVEFPADYEEAALAGKKCAYFVQIKEIQEKKLEPLDEAFYTRYGVKSDAELEEKIREHLRKSYEANDRAEQKNQIYQFLLQRTEMELPESEVNEEIERAVREEVEGLAYRRGRTELSEEERSQLIKRSMAMGTMRVKLRYILRRIAEAEKVTVQPDEVRRAIASAVISRGGTMKDVEKVTQRPGAYEETEEAMRISKVSDWLLTQAKVETAAKEENKA